MNFILWIIIMNKSWFSLVEVIVWVFILSICAIWIVGWYNFLMDRDKQIDSILTNIYFNKYIYDIASISAIPELNIWNKFYLTINWNSYSISLDPVSNKNNVWFFYSTEESPYSHEIKLIWINTIKWVTYDTYKIKTIYNQNEKISYLTK